MALDQSSPTISRDAFETLEPVEPLGLDKSSPKGLLSDGGTDEFGPVPLEASGFEEIK